MSNFLAILIPTLIVIAIGFVVGLGLALAAKFMSVKVDEKEEKIRECLPGANCGACGFSGCDGFAGALAKGECKPNLCTAGGESVAKALSDILGVEVKTESKVAFIACGATRDLNTQKYSYEGAFSCNAAAMLYSGPLSCEYGCLGYGDCINVCDFNAISVMDGKVAVCADICTGCGKCTKFCPKGIISLIPKGVKTYVACSNKQKGAQVAKACKVSCISCMQCEKVCPNNAIKIIDNVAVIDYSLCDFCGKCKEVCKRNVIK